VKRPIALLLSTAVGALWAGGVLAAEPPSDIGPAPGPLGAWLDGIQLSGRIEVGATMNPQSPDNGINFGHLFTDKANQLVLNQFALTAERAPDPQAGFSLGFRVQGMYGLDSQFTHFEGLGDHPTTGRNSFDLLEGDLEAHAGVLTPGGVDLKLGFFPTPMGYEQVDPTRDFFYSKSYIFNFGLPRKHAGLLTTTHVGGGWDLYLGYTTGVNTSLGSGGGYNDGQPHVLAGVGLDWGRVNIKALTHIGPEDAPSMLPPGVDAHRQRRYINDVVIDWKVTDRLTSVTELNYVRDDGLRAQAGGVAEYLTWPLSPIVTAGLRAEFWRDAQGAFVAGYPGNEDYLNAEEGLPNGAYRAGPATYGALTLGLNIRPTGLPRMIDGLTVRPELRYDRVLAGVGGFGATPGASKDQVTIGADVVVPLSFPAPAQGGGGAGDFITSTRAPAPDEPPPSQGAPGARASSPLFLASEERAGSPRSGAVTLITAAELDHLQPRTLQDLDGFAPNLSIGRTDMAPASAAITLRGLGDSRPQGGRPPAVGLVVDGVVMGTTTGQLIDLFDAGQVSVERGPAGLFDGEGAIGGVIAVQRALPTRKWGLQASYGLEQGYHTNIEQGLLNAPVGTTAGLSLAVSHQQRGGYLNNIYTGDGLYGRDERTTGALRFDWNITPRLEALVGVTLTHQDGEGTPLALGDPLAARLLGPSLRATIPGVQFNGFGTPFVPGATQPLGPYTVANDYPDRNLLTSQVYSLALTYDSPVGRFASITAYMKQNDETRQDLDGGCAISDLGGKPCPVLANPVSGFLHVARSGKYDQVTQEFRYSRDFWGRAHLAAGVFYLHNDASGAELDLSALPAGTVAPGGSKSSPPSRQLSDDILDSKAVFASLAVDVTSRLRVSGGLRYVDDEASFSQSSALTFLPLIGPGVFPLTASAGAERTHKVLTRFTIDYQLSGGSLLYAERTVGMRPGGRSPFATLSEQIPGQTNYDPANPRANYSTFGPETATTYEIGSKNTLFDRQLTVNLAGFFTEDRDHQADEVVATPGYGPLINTYVVNIPKVEIKGAELELAWRPAAIGGLTLSGAGGYQDARITSGLIPGAQYPVNADATAGAPGTTVNLAGTPLERSPRFNAMLRGDYALRVAGGIVDLDAGYRWTDRYALAEVAGQPDWQAAYGLVDVSVSYSRDFYRLSVAARNLTNHLYFSSATPALFVHGWGDPRTVVVALQVGF
jgi:iron complex outermembrane receptor protein